MKMYKSHCILQKNEESYNHLDGLGHQSWNNLQLFVDTIDYVKKHLKLNSNIEKISAELLVWLNTIIKTKGISSETLCFFFFILIF